MLLGKNSYRTAYSRVAEYLSNSLFKGNERVQRIRFKNTSESKLVPKEDMDVLIHEYSVLERNYSNLCHSLLTIYSDAVRLEAENEFMVRLINSYNKNE